MIDLTILICSIHTRYKTFLPKIQEQIYGQLAELSDDDQARVEIIVLTDNKQIILGHKRNTMVDIAQGKYVAFVDDDDRLAPEYLSELLKATSKNTDAIVFNASVSLNGEPPKTCYYSKTHRRDYNHRDGYFRIPNHICCIKRDIALQCKFPEVVYGEDAEFSMQLRDHIKTEHQINKTLYFYDYSAATTETQSWRSKPTKPGEAKVDVIILSKADKPDDVKMTQRTIDSCLAGSNGIPVNIIVIESGFGVYHNAATIPNNNKFNYNQFANEGAALGTAPWIMVANNDLEFKEGWLHALLKANHPIVSPHEPRDPRQTDIRGNTTGSVNGKHLCGWCFMISRQLWADIGGFDTDVSFWCSDDVVIEQVKAKGVLPMVVKDSIVLHLYSQTLNKLPSDVADDLKWRNIYIFNKKYGKNKFVDRTEYKVWLQNNKDRIKP